MEKVQFNLINKKNGLKQSNNNKSSLPCGKRMERLAREWRGLPVIYNDIVYI